MSKVTFDDIDDQVWEILETEGDWVFLTNVTEKKAHSLTLQFSKLTLRGLRIFRSLVISYRDVDGEDWGEICNHYSELCREHKKITRNC